MPPLGHSDAATVLSSLQQMADNGKTCSCYLLATQKTRLKTSLFYEFLYLSVSGKYSRVCIWSQNSQLWMLHQGLQSLATCTTTIFTFRIGQKLRAVKLFLKVFLKINGGLKVKTMNLLFMKLWVISNKFYGANQCSS